MSIWTKPRATIAQIVQENPNRGLWWLAFIYGFSSLLNTFHSMLLGKQVGLGAIFLLAAIFAPLLGYVTFSVWSFVVLHVGRWLKGAGTFQAVRAAEAWSCCPLIINGVLWILLAIAYGRSLFATSAEGDTLTRGYTATIFGILFIRLVATIWSLVIYLNALAEVQKFSVLRAIGSVVISAILFFIVLTLLSLLIFNGANK